MTRNDLIAFALALMVADGEGFLWFAHQKHWLLGRKIGPEWFEGN